MVNTEALTYEVNWLPYVVPFSGVRTRNQKCSVWKTFSKICVFGNCFNPIYRGSQKLKSFAFSCENRIHVWTGAEISIFLNSDDRSQPKEMAINLKSYYSALMGMLAYREKKMANRSNFRQENGKSHVCKWFASSRFLQGRKNLSNSIELNRTIESNNSIQMIIVYRQC